MAVTVSRTKSAFVPQFVAATEVTFDNSYAEGGEALTAAQLGLQSIDFAIANVVAGTESATLRAVTSYYTPSTAKIHLIDSATGKEVAKETDMSKVKVLVLAFGRGRA